MFKKKYKRSYSQVGEDMVVDFLFEVSGISCPSYIDIGAHDPYNYSNTAFFYEKGSRGINIEPNPVLYKKFTQVRKKDINLNIGIGDNNDILDFYVINVQTMSTFSKEQAETLVKEHNFAIDDVIKVKVKTIDYVLEKYNGGKFPDFLSLDAEGMDFEILKTINYENNYPKVICVETIEYSNTIEQNKESNISEFLQERGYKVFADTHINTILYKM